MRNIILFSVVFSSAYSANILFLSLLPSPTHHVWNEAVAQALLMNGHNITLLGHEKTNLKLDNYTVLQIEGFRESYEDDIDAASLFKLNSIQNIFYLWEFNLEICKHDFESNSLKILMEYPKDSFDLIIFDLNAGQCLYPLIEIFNNPPVVGVSPFGVPSFIADVMGNHIYPYIPFYTLPYSDRMNFPQRLHNVFLQMLENIVKWCFYMPDFYKKAQKFFGEDIRCFHEVEMSIGLLLSNNDPVLDFPQPFPPNIIPVGGLHVKSANSLTQDIKELLDNSKFGVIYFSLGQIKTISNDVKQVLLDAFGRLNETVLWNFEEDYLEVPPNVIINKSFQQNDILGHRNTKLFITHGDNLSIQEAMYHGIPVIGIPLFGDQHGNLAKIINKNLGKKLDYLNLNFNLVHQTILEVLNNPVYRENMRELAKRFRDQPQTPTDRAIFWIEYALRNKNLNHLNIAAKYMSFYETLSLDIAFIAILCCILLVYALYTIYELILLGIQANTVKKKLDKNKEL